MRLKFRKGTIEDTEHLIRFLEEVRAGMSRKDWFYLDPPEVVRAMMTKGIMELWVAEDGNRMAAIFDVLYPGLESYNYGYDLGLPEGTFRTDPTPVGTGTLYQHSTIRDFPVLSRRS